MSLAIVQQADTATGPSWALGSSVGSRNAVAMAVITPGGGQVASVSGLGATWARVGSPVTDAASVYVLEWWVGTATGTGTAIDITLTAGSQCYAQATEVSGVVDTADGGHDQAASGTTASLTLTGLSVEEMALVFAYVSGWTVAPSSPWTTYLGSNNYWQSDAYFSVATLLTSGSSDETATWTQANGEWTALGLVLSGKTPSKGSLFPFIRGAGAF